MIGCRTQDLGLIGLGLRRGLGLRVYGLGFRVQGEEPSGKAK